MVDDLAKLTLGQSSISSKESPGFNHFVDWGDDKYWYWRGFKCHWRVIGEVEAKPMVLLHGFGASSAHWRSNAKHFAESGYRVFALDLIGFGKSDQPGLSDSLRGLDNDFWAKQVCAFLVEIVQTDIHGAAVLIGNSLGSLVGLTTLVYKPSSVSALVAAPLPDPAFLSEKSSSNSKLLAWFKEKIVRTLFSILPIEIFLPIITRTFLIKKALQAAYKKRIKSDKELLRIVTRPAQRPTAAKSLRAMCIGMSLRPCSITGPALFELLEKRLNVKPILLVWGSEDMFVPLKVGRSIKKKHPMVSFCVIDSVGHCPHDESPLKFNQTVMSWLNRNLPTQEIYQ